MKKVSLTFRRFVFILMFFVTSCPPAPTFEPREVNPGEAIHCEAAFLSQARPVPCGHAFDGFRVQDSVWQNVPMIL